MPRQTILSCYFRVSMKDYNLRGFHPNAIQGHAYQGKMGLHMCVPEIFGLVALS